MGTISSIRKPFLSAIAFFGTLCVLSIGYSAYSGLSSATAGQGLTSAAWNQAKDNFDDLNSRLSNFSFSSGNVGIGTASPGAKLEVAGSVIVGTNRPLTLRGTGGGLDSQGDSGGWAFGYHAKGSSGTDRGGFGFLGSGDALSYYYIGSTYSSPTVAVFPANGNVGIGTVSPSQKLEVAGIVYSTSGGFKFPDGTVQTTASSAGTGAGRITGGCAYGTAWGTATACGLSQGIGCSAGNAARPMTYHTAGGVAQWNGTNTYASGFCVSQ